MKTKTGLYILILSVFGIAHTSIAQEETFLNWNHWYLNENTNLDIYAEYDDKEQFVCFVAESFYGLENDRTIFRQKGDKLQFYFLNSKSVDYYDEAEMDTVGTAEFRVLEFSDTILSIRPLDVGAVRFLDQLQQQGYTIVGEPERDDKFYNDYWKEVSKAKGKKRDAVISKWETEHRLYADKAVFHEEKWYTELKNEDDHWPLIDSIYYSEMLISNDAKDSAHYVDYKIYGNGDFVMRQFSALRTPNDGVPDVIFENNDYEMENIEFIPPVITEKDNTDAPDYEMDVESDKVELNSPKTEGNKIDPSDEGVYDGYKSDIVYFDETEEEYVDGSDADGYYKGTFSPQWIQFVNAGVNTYGPSRQIHLGDSTGYFCDSYSMQCGKKHFRIFYNGTYKDIWIQNFRSPILLYNFLFEFSEKEDFYTSFEQSENKNENFPTSLLAK